MKSGKVRLYESDIDQMAQIVEATVSVVLTAKKRLRCQNVFIEDSLLFPLALDVLTKYAFHKRGRISRSDVGQKVHKNGKKRL